VRLEGLSQLKESNDLIGNRTRALPPCSIDPQPTSLPHASISDYIHLILFLAFGPIGHIIEHLTIDKVQKLSNPKRPRSLY
jgi:hypothetical protein